LEPAFSFSAFPDVGQTTDPANIDLSAIEQALPFLPRNFSDEFRWETESLSNVCRKCSTERLCNFCLAGTESQHDDPLDSNYTCFREIEPDRLRFRPTRY